MRWLQWSTIDLESGLGGVEVHARSVARELRGLGVEVGYSQDPSIWESASLEWDVLHTHGSAIPLRWGGRSKQPKRIHVHTLHGTTLGRMASCGEWAWPGGYAAELREIQGVLSSDLVLSVHPGLSLLKLAQRIGKPTAVCLNGWDAGLEREPLLQSTEQLLALKPSPWVFVGRSRDPVKAVDALLTALRLVPDIELVAVPGEGFESAPQVRQTGRLTPGQILSLLDRAAGLILCSRYEGNSLAMLEALAQGVPVVSTPVGAAPLLSGYAEGLVVADSHDPRAIADAMRNAARLPLDPASRHRRAEHNRSLLPTWKQVAQTCLAAVELRVQPRPQERKS